MEDPAPSLRKMADVLQHITKHYQAGPKSRKERGWLRINKNTMTKEVMSTILSKKPKCGPVPPGEVVVRVAVFHPTKSDKTQEILILGSQKLIDLKNAIDCITENILVEQEGDEIPCIHSSYFYINRTFYDYIAPGDSEPLSQRITTWAKQKEKEGEIRFRRLRNRKMENVRVVDLDIQLGAHYHFCHAIDENHTIIFTEIRFHDAFDPQDRGAYPLDVFKWQEKMRKCCSCAVNHAQLVIYGDKLSASNPAYYCEMCHKAFHKDSQGNDIYLDYHVHPYTHD
uniref:snRNA-activating protein complex subunit 3 n=1 Tax=Amorphochlora amoebiformis TaxID=1561963 RepID=A0A7S0DBM8_9EUKA